jgi:hypothetical protein
MSVALFDLEIAETDGFDLRPGSAGREHGPGVEHLEALIPVPLVPCIPADTSFSQIGPK